MEQAKKLALSASASGTLFWFYAKSKGFSQVQFENMSMPVWAFGGLVGAGSNLLTEGVNSLIIPEIALSNRMKRIEGVSLPPLVNGVGMYGATRVALPEILDDVGGVELVALGAVSELVGQKLYDMFLAPTDEPSSFEY